MHETTRKSFYIFLTAVLGVLLFLTIQRSAFLLVYLLGTEVNPVLTSSLEVLTGALAITLGGWYGVWLGLLWYRAIYEEGTSKSIWAAVRGYAGGSKDKQEGEWEIDDLVALESIDPKTKKPTVEYIEAGAVKWKGRAPQVLSENPDGVAVKKKAHRRLPSAKRTLPKRSIT